ncbi:hypothetical protein GCM10025770_13420 [Viridibacterium curvum]|uniref:Uncharacterized protein n=1 Tax=Viridibacterium curvum TaxID=1101404 RepID=A0ABP9QIR2_9RHOO
MVFVRWFDQPDPHPDTYADPHPDAHTHSDTHSHADPERFMQGRCYV